MTDSQNTGITPVVTPLPERRTWGAWATIGYSMVIMAAFFFTQFIVIMISLVVVLSSRDISFDPGNITDLMKIVKINGDGK